MKNVDNYKTKCQFLASTLYALGQKLTSSEKVDGRVFMFFEDKKKCEEIISRYYSGDLRIDPRKLFDSFVAVKSVIYNR